MEVPFVPAYGTDGLDRSGRISQTNCYIHKGGTLTGAAFYFGQPVKPILEHLKPVVTHILL